MFRSFLVLASTLLAGQFVQAQLTPSIVNVPGAPLKILSVTSESDNFLAKLQLQNVFAKPIYSYKLGTIIAIPRGCGEEQVIGPVTPLSEDIGDLSPGDVSTTMQHHFSPRVAQAFKDNAKAKNVYTQLAVIEVVFKDGTRWSWSKTGQTFDDALLSATGELMCGTSKRAEMARAAVQLNCPLTKLKPVQKGDGGGYYTCAAAANQVCSNAADARSCTSIVCPGINCPSQACSFVGSSGPVTPIPVPN